MSIDAPNKPASSSNICSDRKQQPPVMSSSACRSVLMSHEHAFKTQALGSNGSPHLYLRRIARSMSGRCKFLITFGTRAHSPSPRDV
jgi:hypothetical protein